MKTLDKNAEFINIEDILEVIKEGTADNVEELKSAIEVIGEDADTLIREDYFSEFIYDFINESEEISDGLKGYIDWNRLEEANRMNYYEVEIGGVSYLTLA